MEELIQALKIRKKWNKMPVEKFLEEYHKYYKKTPEETGYTTEWINNTWKYTGLLNIDLITLNKKI